MNCPVCPKGECNCPQMILRLALGVVMFAHGSQKVLGWFGGPGLNKTLAMFTQGMHIPMVVAWLPIIAEFLGGLGLIFGFLTRLSAFAIGVDMLVAVLMIHIHNGFFMNWMGNQKGEGFEYHILAIAIALALMMMGGGCWSLDRCIWKCKEKKA